MFKIKNKTEQQTLMVGGGGQNDMLLATGEKKVIREAPRNLPLHLR